MATPFFGEIQQVGFNWAPHNYVLCDGQQIAISQNPTLYSLLGDHFGGDSRTYFNIPDLRGRVPVHVGLDILQQGQSGGTETVTLTETQIGHTHPLYGTNTDANNFRPIAGGEGNSPANTDDAVYGSPTNLKPFADGLITSQGGGQAHANVQPFTAICFIMAIDGIYPSRN